MSAQILTVPAAEALQWLAGRMDDEALAALAPKNEVIFARQIDNRRDLLDAVRKLTRHHAAGCVALFGRATTDEWLAQLEAAGCERFFQQPNGKWRYWASPQNFDRWISWLKRHHQ